MQQFEALGPLEGECIIVAMMISLESQLLSPEPCNATHHYTVETAP